MGHAKTGVIIGFLGKLNENGHSHNMYLIDKYEELLKKTKITALEKMLLFIQPPVSNKESAEAFTVYARRKLPGLKIIIKELQTTNLWDYESVTDALIGAIQYSDFKPDKHRYYIYTSTGTHVALTCMYLLIERGLWMGDIIQTVHDLRWEKEKGAIKVIETDALKISLAKRIQVQSEQIQQSLVAALHTDNPNFKKIIDEIEVAAVRSRASVLLLGNTGTGKSKLAKLIAQKRHEYKLLETDKFIAVNCATLSGNLLQSELFGYEKGAFTGALEPRPGKLEAADKGLLFLDEIGDMDLQAQAMLLKAIEEGEFIPVGGNKVIKSNFQLICATNKDLFEEIARGRFRADLLARINVWTFTLPDFAERRGDLDKLFEAAVKGRSKNKLERELQFEDQAQKKFLRFAQSGEALWTANYRDLNTAIERMAVLSGDSAVTEAIVEREIEHLLKAWAGGRPKDIVDEVLGERSAALNRLERAELSCALAVCHRHKTCAAAARELYGPPTNKSNVSSKLAALLGKYHLRFEDITSL